MGDETTNTANTETLGAESTTVSIEDDPIILSQDDTVHTEPSDGAGDAEKSKGEPEGESKGGADAGDSEPKPGLSAETLSLAEQYGWEKDDLEGLDEGRVVRLVAGFERRLLDTAGPSTPAPQGQNGRAQQPPAADAGDTGLSLLELSGVDLAGVKTEEFDESLAGVLKTNSQAFGKVQSYVNSLAKAADHQLQSLQQVVGNLTTELNLERFDRFVGDLGNDYEDVLGKGETLDLIGQKSKFGEARAKIYESALALQRAYGSKFQQPLTLKRAWGMALRAEFPDKLAAGERKKISKSLKKRQSSLSDTPDRTPGKPPVSDKERALQALRGL